MTDLTKEMRNAAKEDAYYKKALGITPNKRRRQGPRRKAAAKPPVVALPCHGCAKLSAAIALLGGEIKRLRLTLAKPRPTRPPFGRVYAQYREPKS